MQIRPLAYILLLTYVLAGTGRTAAAAGAWKTAVDKDGITCSKREVEGSKLLEIRCDTIFRVPVSTSMAVMLDFDSYTEWHPLYQETKVLARPTPDSWIVYTVTNGQWPVQPRDVVDYGRLQVDPSGHGATYSFEITSTSMRPPVKGYVREPFSQGSMTWTSMDGGQATKFTGTQRADPGGMLPAFLVNFISSSLAFDAVQALRKHCEKQGGNPELRGRFRILDDVNGK